MALDLQSGRSHWLLANRELPSFPKLQSDRNVEVAIIGAGVTGALAAALLVEAGIEVAVLDRRELGCGSTGASTALLSYEPDTSFEELASMRGHDAAVRAYVASRDANAAIGQLIERLGISCEYAAASSLYLARKPGDETEIREEYRLRREAGLECEYLDAGALRERFGMVGRVGIVSAEAGQVDPVRLTAGLLEFVVAQGSSCERAHVIQLRDTARGIDVVTEEGHVVHAGRVVIAGGYETQLTFPQPGVSLVSTYAIATSVVEDMPAWMRTQILWDMDEPYHYLRTADGRVLVGGCDEPFVDEVARDRLMLRKSAELHDYVRTILPWLEAPCSTVWCGTFARSQDGLPFIGGRRDMPGVSSYLRMAATESHSGCSAHGSCSITSLAGTTMTSPCSHSTAVCHSGDSLMPGRCPGHYLPTAPFHT